MSASDPKVVGQDRHSLEDRSDEGLALRTAPAPRHLDADDQLRHGQGGDGEIVVAAEQRVDVVRSSFGIDEEDRVEEQQAQGRSRPAVSHEAHRGRRSCEPGSMARESLYSPAGMSIRPVTGGPFGSVWGRALEDGSGRAVSAGPSDRCHHAVEVPVLVPATDAAASIEKPAHP